MLDLIKFMLSQPEASSIIEKFGRLTTLISKCQNCTIFAFDHQRISIIYRSGHFDQTIDEQFLEKLTAIVDFSSFFEVNDIHIDPRFYNKSTFFSNLGITYLTGFPITTGGQSGAETIAALCCDAEPHKPSIMREVRLLELAGLAQPALNLIGSPRDWATAATITQGRPADRVASSSLLGDVWDTNHSSNEDEPLVEPGQSVVAKFLLETLPLQPRMLSRNRLRYFAVRSWRTPIKKYQIAALKSIKAEKSNVLVDDIAKDLMATILEIHGLASNCVVTPVPCGHSGPDCLSCKIARKLSEKLGVEFIEAFHPIETKGSSHPITNARRPRMKLRVALDRPVILVDDVATSGSHIAEAAALLRRTSPNVWPIAWIGG